MRLPDNIPNEILEEIFLIAVTKQDGLHDSARRTDLLMVCTSWNAIIEQLPQMWTHIYYEDGRKAVIKSLELSKPLPIACISGLDLTSPVFFNWIEADLHRSRDLQLCVDRRDYAVRLTAPAPIARTAYVLNHSHFYEWSREIDLFGGEAPCLESLQLVRLGIPVRPLTSFADGILIARHL